MGTLAKIEAKTKLVRAVARMRGKRVYFDTAPIIFALENSKGYAELALPFLLASEARQLFGFTGLIAYCETLVKPLQSKNTKVVDQVKEIFEKDDIFSCVDHTRSAYLLAAELRAEYRLKMVDALHLATAIELRCDYFVTNDFKFKANKRMEVVCIDDLREVENK